MITLKLLCFFVIINAYDIYNGTYNLNISNIIYKDLERRHQTAIQEKAIDVDLCVTYIIQFYRNLCKGVIQFSFPVTYFINDHS